MAKILLVEDEPDLAVLIQNWLRSDHHLVEIVSNGLDAWHCLNVYSYDLMILDLQLPGLSGMDVCRKYRMAKGGIPIIMITARDSVDDKEAGLNAGADDYLTKPFHLKELAARVRTLLRRPPIAVSTRCVLGDVLFDPINCSVQKSGEDVHLLPKEYRLLEFLFRHPNQVFSAEALFDSVWESDACSSLDTVRGHIMRLRSKLDTPGAPSIIETVRRIGYKLNAPEA